MSNKERSGRRGFLSKVGVAAGAVAIAAPQRALADITGVTSERNEPSALGLEVSQRVGQWTIVAVHGARFGAIPVIMQAAAGGRFQLDVLRRDADPTRPDGVGNTGSLSIYLANSGDGDTPTHEEHGLGAMALADALAVSNAALPSELLTFAERNERHPRAAYSVPLD
jgi:hypothetical protein